MNKHTPGPWTNESMEFSAGWRCLVTCSDGRQFDIADPRERKTDATDAANARLIAAAPDLLEALRGLYEDQMDYIRLNNLSGAEDNHWMKAARAAIAKATTP